MATPLPDGRPQINLRRLLPAIGLTLACVSAVHGQAVTQAFPQCSLAIQNTRPVAGDLRVTFEATPNLPDAQYRFRFGDTPSSSTTTERAIVSHPYPPGTYVAFVDVVRNGRTLCTAQAIVVISTSTASPDTVFVVRHETVINRIGEILPLGPDTLEVGDTLYVTTPDSARAPTPFLILIPEEGPSPPSLWWLVLLLALLLLGQTYLLWRVWHYLPLLMKYRDRKAWTKIYRLVQEMPASLAKLPLVRQQHAFALNRDGRGEEAEGILRALLDEQGPSTKTNGILGRVYKDRWEAARKTGQTKRAADLLNQAIETYLTGHKAHPEHPYPGLNALTLLTFYDALPDGYDGLDTLVRQVSDAARDHQDPDDTYWDHAARLEVAVLGGDEEAARTAAAEAVSTARVAWQIETTLNNLRLLREARETKGEPPSGWVRDVEATLGKVMESLARKPRSRGLFAWLRLLFG